MKTKENHVEGNGLMFSWGIGTTKTKMPSHNQIKLPMLLAIAMGISSSAIMAYLLINIMLHEEVIIYEPNGVILTLEIILTLWCTIMLSSVYVMFINNYCKEVVKNEKES